MIGRGKTQSFLFVASATLLSGATLAACGTSHSGAGKSPANSHVLLVGTYQGDKGQYATIQDAVNHAKPGDWILIGPGDYHEVDDHLHPPTAAEADVGEMGGVLIKTPDIHLRGMNRDTVIVDGTKPGAPNACDPNQKWQDFGVVGSNGKAYGRDGIVVWKANGVSVDNLTVCNFLTGAGASGNEVWWNGGDESAKIGLKGYWGYYLTATTSFYNNENTAAAYGIFSSNSAGPGNWNYLYANNFNDSGMYVGACQQQCDMTIDHAWMENSALGYSGTNSGGKIVIENSQFDDNEDGLDTNTQINGDPPAPQDGACPTSSPSPITHTHSCWVFIDNSVHDNNNPDTPKAGGAAAGPTGTGMTVSGGTNDTVMDNKFYDNGAWGILFVPYPDENPPQDHQSCSGTGGHELKPFGCVYDPMNDALLHNTFSHNGYFGNPSNSDFGQITLFAGQPQNCYAGNLDPDGSAPSDLERIQPTCGATTKASDTGGPLLGQVLCDTGFLGCPKGAKYPKSHSVRLAPLPKDLPTMPKPCAGVPANPWCPKGGGGYSAGAPRHTPVGGQAGLYGAAFVGAGVAVPGLAGRRRRRPSPPAGWV